MKKYAILGLVFAVFAFASCKLEKGGSVEVINKGDSNAIITVLKGSAVVGAEQNAGAGDKVTYSIDEDGNYIVSAVYVEPLPGDLVRKYIIVSGGNTVTVMVSNH
ncbi:MAG: hypothetical protein LBC52_08115 [Treponema sp.]|jgi:hypothetical protein|nr:hypothetical protein [Treponema sp.]